MPTFRDTVTGLFVSAANALSRPKGDTVKQTFRRTVDHEILRDAIDQSARMPNAAAALLTLNSAIERVLNRR